MGGADLGSKGSLVAARAVRGLLCSRDGAGPFGAKCAFQFKEYPSSIDRCMASSASSGNHEW